MNEWTMINARLNSEGTFLNNFWQFYLDLLETDSFLTATVTVALFIIILILTCAWCYCCWKCICRMFRSKSRMKVKKRKRTFSLDSDSGLDQWFIPYSTLRYNDYDDNYYYDDEFDRRKRKRKRYRSFSRRRSHSSSDSSFKHRRSYSLQKDPIFDAQDYSYQYKNPLSNIVGTKTKESYEELLYFLKESMKKKKKKKYSKPVKIVIDDEILKQTKPPQRRQATKPVEINLEPPKSIRARIESLKEAVKIDINKKIQSLVASINREVSIVSTKIKCLNLTFNYGLILNKNQMQNDGEDKMANLPKFDLKTYSLENAIKSSIKELDINDDIVIPSIPTVEKKAAKNVPKQNKWLELEPDNSESTLKTKKQSKLNINKANNFNKFI